MHNLWIVVGAALVVFAAIHVTGTVSGALRGDISTLMALVRLVFAGLVVWAGLVLAGVV
jgi:hypothetical protein